MLIEIKMVAGDLKKAVVENFKKSFFSLKYGFITVKQIFLNILFTHYILFI